MNVSCSEFRRLFDVCINTGWHIHSKYKALCLVDANDRFFRHALQRRLESGAKNRIKNEIRLKRLLDLRLAEIFFVGNPQTLKREAS